VTWCAPQTEKIRIDSRESHEKLLLAFADRFVAELKEMIEFYPGERPLLISTAWRMRYRRR